jgi:hypothetical protein
MWKKMILIIPILIIIPPGYVPKVLRTMILLSNQIVFAIVNKVAALELPGSSVIGDLVCSIDYGTSQIYSIINTAANKMYSIKPSTAVYCVGFKGLCTELKV